MRTAARTLAWIAAILGAGLAVVALAGQIVSPAVYRALLPLVEDFAPVMSYGILDVVAPALSVGLAVLVMLGIALVLKLPLGRSLIAIIGGLTLVLGWSVAIEGVNIQLVAAALGGVVGGATVLLARYVAGLRATDLGPA